MLLQFTFVLVSRCFENCSTAVQTKVSIGPVNISYKAPNQYPMKGGSALSD